MNGAAPKFGSINESEHLPDVCLTPLSMFVVRGEPLMTPRQEYLLELGPSERKSMINPTSACGTKSWERASAWLV